MRATIASRLDRLAGLALRLTRPTSFVRCCAGLCAVALMVGVLTLGATPLAVGAVGDGWDKLAHTALHFVLSLCLLVALRWRAVRWVILVCLVFATTDEIAQLYEPGRSASFVDWAADILGTSLGVACASLAVWMRSLNEAQSVLARSPE